MSFNKDTFCMMTHQGFFVQPDRKVKPCCIFDDFDKPVIFDCMVDKQENCYPMIPSGKPHNQMLLGPKDQKNKKITRKGRTLV